MLLFVQRIFQRFHIILSIVNFICYEQTVSDERTIKVDVENVFSMENTVEANNCKILLFNVKLDLVNFRCSYISSRPCVQGVNFVLVFHLYCFMSVYCCIVQETYVKCICFYK